MKKLNICLLFLLLLVTLNFQPVVTTEVHAADPPWNADARVSMFYDALLPYAGTFRRKTKSTRRNTACTARTAAKDGNRSLPRADKEGEADATELAEK